MKRKRTSLTTLRRKCHTKWAEAVKRRDSNRCVLCGMTTHLNAHHIITKRVFATRYVVDNGVTVCAGCHTFRIASVHKSPWILYEWLEQNRPAQYEWFICNRNIIYDKNTALTAQDYEMIYESLETYLEQLEKGGSNGQKTKASHGYTRNRKRIRH